MLFNGNWSQMEFDSRHQIICVDNKCLCKAKLKDVCATMRVLWVELWRFPC